MDMKQLRDFVRQMATLKSPDKSDDFNAGVDAAMNIVNVVVQEAADRERMRQLEVELAELRNKYVANGNVAPKKRGRKPKNANVSEKALHEVE
jgi:hypothetical protein